MTKRNKIIGIPAWNIEGGFGAGGNHFKFIERFGNPKLISPWEPFMEELDMIYLPGGLDISPSSYGEAPKSTTSNTDVIKQHFFDHHLQNYINAGTAIFGVCLGAQMLAVKFGSTLVQDLVLHPQSRGRGKVAHPIFPYPLSDRDREQILTESVKTSSPSIEGECEDEYEDYQYDEEFDEDEEDEELSNTQNTYSTAPSLEGALDVNSHHHQAVTLNRLGKDLIPLFVYPNLDSKFSDDDDIVEVFRHKRLPIVGVQYHPEDLLEYKIPDYLSIEIMKELLGL